MTGRPHPNPIYVVTCGLCGQTWHRTGLTNGDALDCIFCGRRGQLVFGLFPSELRAGERVRIEAWLIHAGP